MRAAPRRRLRAPRSSRFPMTAGGWSATVDPPLDEEHPEGPRRRRLPVARLLPARRRRRRPLHGVLRQSATGRHDPFAAELPAWRRLGAGCAKAGCTIANADGHGRDIIVNRYIVQKGLERQLVLYWYQSHGRVVASEYWSKAYPDHRCDSHQSHRRLDRARDLADCRHGDDDGAAAERLPKNSCARSSRLSPLIFPNSVRRFSLAFLSIGHCWDCDVCVLHSPDTLFRDLSSPQMDLRRGRLREFCLPLLEQPAICAHRNYLRSRVLRAPSTR